MSVQAKHTPTWRIVAAALVVVLVQASVVGAMILERAAILSQGREIVIRTVPIDPRDLFRGDYVILRYGVSRVSLAGLEAPEDLRRAEAVFVTLAPSEDDEDDWSVVSISRDRPDTVADGAVVIAARVAAAFGSGEGRTARIDYGIESYFVPEGTGRALEDKVRESVVSVIVAVADSGKAAVKGLVIDGERIYDEPLL